MAKMKGHGRTEDTAGQCKFHCPPLPPARIAQITKEANTACDELMKYSAGESFRPAHENRTGSSSTILNWTFLKYMDSIRVEKARVPSTSFLSRSSSYYLRGSTQIPVSLEEIKELYAVDMNNSNIQIATKLNPALLHSVILHEIQAYNANAQRTAFIGIRWHAERTPFLVFRNRDYCYMEIQRVFTLPDGRRGFARCLHSVNIKSCPSLEHSHGLVRASMYRSGLVFIESMQDRRVLDVVEAKYIDLKGHVPQFLASFSLRQQMASLVQLKKFIDMRRFAGQGFVQRSEWVTRENAIDCYVCGEALGTKKSGVFNNRFNCQKCGEVVCRNCKTAAEAEIPVVGRMKLTICLLCTRAHNQDVVPDSMRSSNELGRPSTMYLADIGLHSNRKLKSIDSDDEPTVSSAVDQEEENNYGIEILKPSASYEAQSRLSYLAPNFDEMFQTANFEMEYQPKVTYHMNHAPKSVVSRMSNTNSFFHTPAYEPNAPTQPTWMQL